MKLTAPFQGIITPIITPLSDNETLDKKSLDLLINHIIAGGVHGVFILGTTGEGPSLAYRLKRELIIYTCEQVKGKIPVFVGITDNSTDESIALAKIAEENGAAALVAAPPSYYNLSQNELIIYYQGLADKITLPLFIYNIPSQTKIMIEAETVKILASHSNIVGIKDSSGNAVYFNSLLYHLKEKKSFSLLAGPDEMLASSVIMGGHGGVNSGSNLYPGLFTELYNAAKAKNIKEMLLLQEKVMELSTKIYKLDISGSYFLKGLKTALFISGFCSDFLLGPLNNYQEKEKNIIKENLIILNKLIN